MSVSDSDLQQNRPGAMKVNKQGKCRGLYIGQLYWDTIISVGQIQKKCIMATTSSFKIKPRFMSALAPMIFHEFVLVLDDNAHRELLLRGSWRQTPSE